MKIKSYQLGGIAYRPTVDRNVAAAGTSAAASSDNTGAGKVPGFTKEVIDLVKENGLDSDVTVFLDEAENILNLAADPAGEHLSMREILKMQKMANLVKTQYEDYKEAVKSLDVQDAWGEVATTKRGYLYVMDSDGNIKQMSSSQYSKEKDKYTPLTNEDVLNLRRRHPEYAYNSSILDDVQGAVGVNSIMERLEKMVQQLGTTDVTGYGAKMNQDIKSGINSLLDDSSNANIRDMLTISPDGIYKISKKTTVADTHIAEAAQYLLNNLPNTYKNALIAKAAAEGYDPDAMVMQMLFMNRGRELSAQYEKDASEEFGFKLKANSKGGSNSGEQLTQNNYLQRLSNGEFGPRRPVRIIAKGDTPEKNAELNTLGWDVGPMIDRNNKTLSKSNLTGILSDAWGIQAGNTDAIYFGNRKISGNETSAILWEGQSHLNVVQLPITRDEYGNIKPDFEITKELQKINKEAATRTYKEIQDYINATFDDPQNVYYNQNAKKWEYKIDATMPFLTFKAIAGKKSLKLKDDDLLYLEHIDRNRGKQLEDIYNLTLNYNTTSKTKDAKPINDFKESRADDFYEGNVYIPIDNPYGAWNVSGIDEWFTKDTFTDVSERMQLKDAAVRQNAQNGEIIVNW